MSALSSGTQEKRGSVSLPVTEAELEVSTSQNRNAASIPSESGASVHLSASEGSEQDPDDIANFTDYGTAAAPSASPSGESAHNEDSGSPSSTSDSSNKSCIDPTASGRLFPLSDKPKGYARQQRQ